MESKEKCLDPQLWHACAGGMVQMPELNSKVYYFPQGHAEHSCGLVNFSTCPKVQPFVLCKVEAIKYMVDPETDEVYAKLRLVPLNGNEAYYGFDGVEGINGSENKDKVVSFEKTLTPSDANNGGGFSVPRLCAENVFPLLDYTTKPPVQYILFEDVHGKTWNFRHIYRGTPRRHLLTTGWSDFVNHKKLVAGDSIVFLRGKNGDLRVGIRRAKGTTLGKEASSRWKPAGENSVMAYGGLAECLRGDGVNSLIRNGNKRNRLHLNPPRLSMIGKGNVMPEAVIEAVTLAANNQPFEVVYYPQASTPAFCVKASIIEAALQIRWCSGMRFKMPFETKDSSRISSFMGTISSVQIVDPIGWPTSPWRLLQVTWDEPDLLQIVTKVSPWLVELVSDMPAIPLSPLSPPWKKLRLPQHPHFLQYPDFQLDGHIPPPTFSSNLQVLNNNPFRHSPDNYPARMQGARHDHYGLSLPYLHLNKLQSGLIPLGVPPLDYAATPMRVSTNLLLQKPVMSENVSCSLSMENSTQSTRNLDGVKTPSHIVLFGQTILIEEQISLSNSGDTVSSDRNGSALDHHGRQEHSSSERFPWCKDNRQETEASLEIGHCKIFMESEDVGRTLNLSLLWSYDELYRMLADMFCIEKFKMLNHVLYRDITGAIKHIGDEPFSVFTKTARMLTIVMDSSSDNVGV